MRIPVLRPLAVVAASMTLFSAVPAAANPPIDLRRLPIHFQGDTAGDIGGYLAGRPRGATWSVVGGGLRRDGRTVLDVVVSPGASDLPLDPGPAVLFGSVELYGGAGGDVGMGVRVKELAVSVLPACIDPTDCTYRGSITLPTQSLPALAVRYDAERWMAADISLTLVRTFAQGTWLQAVVLHDESRGYRLDGTLARPSHTTILPQVFGAFPVDGGTPRSRPTPRILAQVERLRRTVEDTSVLPETVPVLVDVTTSACTGGFTLATHTGDVVLDVRALGSSEPVVVPVPVGADLSVFVPSLHWVSNAGDARSFGSISIDGPMRISGRVAGDGRGGTCPPAGRVDWRPASAIEVAEFPVTGRCLLAGGGASTWRPGTIGRCLS